MLSITLSQINWPCITLFKSKIDLYKFKFNSHLHCNWHCTNIPIGNCSFIWKITHNHINKDISEEKNNLLQIQITIADRIK